MRKLMQVLIFTAACMLAAWAHAQSGKPDAQDQLRVPEHIVANAGATLATGGNGDATFYLFGPSGALKKSIRLGEEIKLQPEDVRAAGSYTAVLRAGAVNTVRSFYVSPAPPAAISFLARPSRVPVDRPGVISGVAFVFDDYKNLVLDPADVSFRLAVGDAPPVARSVATRNGIAWASLGSSRRAGAAQFVASLPSSRNPQEVRRVVQQTASDPCNLRFHTQPAKAGLVVETDLVRDCTGNPVPDGTIVTFTEFDGRTRSTIDARIKRGVARAELPATAGATISVASGVVMGNELRVGGTR